MQGLDWQTWRMAFVAGLNQKLGTRELEPPSLSRAVDCQFDKLGDLQTRYPYATLGTDVLGGGSLSNVRRGVENGEEKLVFTKDTLYSWNAQLSKWVSKGTHLAVKVTEQNRFVTGGEQVEIDRAELNNVVVFAWTEYTNTLVSDVYVAAYDKTTGSVIVAPTNVSGASELNTPKLVACSSYILLFVNNRTTSRLNVLQLDPSNMATSVAGAFTAFGSAAHNEYYDVAKIPGVASVAVVHMLNPTTSYGLAIVTEALSVTTSTKARTCNDPPAVACAPNGTHIQVLRPVEPNIVGDYIAISALADVNINQAIGSYTPGLSQVTAAFRSVADGGFYRCYAFWSSASSIDPAVDWQSRYNWVDTNNSIGTEATFVRRLDVGSRAFDHEGRVFVWMNWGVGVGVAGDDGKLQCAAYLYRDDATLVAKSTWNRGFGILTLGHLPNVANTGTGTYSYAGTERAIVGGADSFFFSAARPRDVTITFDSNEARRCVRLGKTLYIAGGEILQYDGVRLTELGFHVWPSTVTLGATGGGSLEDGAYGYKSSYASANAQAEVDRSAAIYVRAITVNPGPARIEVSGLIPIYVTHKSTIACEVWRTKKNPNVDDSYYKASSNNPATQTGSQRYLPNDTSSATIATMNDDYADSTLSGRGTHPQDNTLPNLAPPAASIIAATDTRVFLAGVAGDPNNIWYSKLRADGEVVAFHGALIAPVPAPGGDITAMAFLNETLVVFRENAIYVLPGEGFDNTGGGVNYGPARAISIDIGAVNQESVCVTDTGIVFKSSKGWYRLNRSFSLDYIGAGVVDYDTETPLAVHLVESQHQLRILTASRMLVLDTLGGQWFEWTISDGVHACMWQGTHAYLTSTAPKTQQTSYSTATYGIDVETAWIDLSKMAAFGRVRRFEVLGEYRAAHSFRIRLARDYWADGVDTYFQDRTWTVSPTTVGGPLQVEHGPSIQQVNALKVRITVTPTSVGESCKLSALMFELGFKRGLFRRLPSAQRQ